MKDNKVVDVAPNDDLIDSRATGEHTRIGPKSLEALRQEPFGQRLLPKVRGLLGAVERLDESKSLSRSTQGFKTTRRLYPNVNAIDVSLAKRVADVNVFCAQVLASGDADEGAKGCASHRRREALLVIDTMNL